jgi:hypothetical protein
LVDLGAAFFVTAAFFAAGFFVAGLDELLDFAVEVAPDEREAFSVILLSHASISASSETGETVIAGAIMGDVDASTAT